MFFTKVGTAAPQKPSPVFTRCVAYFKLVRVRLCVCMHVRVFVYVCACGLRLKRALVYLKVHYRSQANPQ